MDIKIKRLLFCDQPHNNIFDYIYYPHKKDSPHNSKHMFDIYFLTHIFWSIILALSLNIFDNKNHVIIMSIIITTFFEIYENMKGQIIKYNRIEKNSSGESQYRGDSLINIIGDIIGNLLGIYLAMKFNISINLIILIILFIVVTQIIGLNYWTEFIKFLIIKFM